MDTETLRCCRDCYFNLPLEAFAVRSNGELTANCINCRQVRADRARQAQLRKWGITQAEYDRLLARQGGVCAICRRDRPGPKRRLLAVDHCHETGRIRGLLCMRCNTSLGAIGDSLDGARRFLDYLKGSLAAGGKIGPRVKPCRVSVTRYVDANGRRVSRDTPGAVLVRQKSLSYYVKLDGVYRTLKTTDEAEANRRLALMRQGLHFDEQSDEQPPRLLPVPPGCL